MCRRARPRAEAWGDRRFAFQAAYNRRVIDPWLLEHLACPRCRMPVALRGEWLTCEQGHRYPVADDVPVMLLDDVQQTHWVATHALKHFAEPVAHRTADAGIDPDVQEAISATGGNLYKHLVGRLTRYPIPTLPFDAPPGTAFLDVGCHWGRWCVAAARKGWRVVGIDPSLSGIRAARHVARSLGAEIALVIGDGRYLPFAPSTFQMVHSYSVLQHFPEEDVRRCAQEMGRVLQPGGTCHVQMAQRMGILNLVNQARRRFRRARLFEVRYWRRETLRRTFADAIGPTNLTVDGFMSLNAQLADLDLLLPSQRAVVQVSHVLRRLSQHWTWLIRGADSVYVNAVKPQAARDR
jgi:SAM-dependent methyltransferase/uncharacterized protein YbaR (Trm112 family)